MRFLHREGLYSGKPISIPHLHPIYRELNSIFKVSLNKRVLKKKPILQIGKKNNFISLTHKESEYSYIISSGLKIGIDIEHLDQNIEWKHFYNRFFSYSDYVNLNSIRKDLQIEKSEYVLFSLKEAVLKTTKLQTDPLQISFVLSQAAQMNQLIQLNYQVKIDKQPANLNCIAFLKPNQNSILTICYSDTANDSELIHLLKSLGDVDFSSIARHLYVMKGMLIRAPDSFFPADLSSDLIQPYQFAIDQKIHESRQQQ